ncbi:hypothetical protein OG742_41800 [Streptomyces sp. NBC_00828]|uniref:hypothetical protein n=1 Tax=Streptomyces sp. NBC_00828 TaxID=2903678 RepID=UPI003868F7D2
MAKDVVEISTSLSVEQVKQIFSTTLKAVSRKVEFGALPASDSPFDEPEDFAASASLNTFMGGWCVQVYVADRGDARIVNLVPVGSSALGRVFFGIKNTYSRSAGRAKCTTVVESLRATDRGLTTA